MSAPEIYRHEWTSFSTRDFPENQSASLYDEAGLRILRCLHPLGKATDPYEWVTESTISPWLLYVLENLA